ncbi:hypothetical protein BDQ17DRAFT_1356282 [Cyathus striatus]|nr:hypothetical protein BDQ17DRAFT_1356282 [Cyathus striatus]
MIDEMKKAPAGKLRTLWPKAVRLYESIYPWLDSANTHDGFITPRYTISAINHFFEAMNEDGPKLRYPDFNAISKDDPLIRASEWYKPDWFEKQGRLTPDPYEDVVSDSAADGPHYVAITPTPTPTPGPSTVYALRKRKISATPDGGSAPRKLRGRKPKPTAWEVIVIDSDGETIPNETPAPETVSAPVLRGKGKRKKGKSASTAVESASAKEPSTIVVGEEEEGGTRLKKGKKSTRKQTTTAVTKSKKGKGKEKAKDEIRAKSKSSETPRSTRFAPPASVDDDADVEDEEEVDQLADDDDVSPANANLADEEEEVAELVTVPLLVEADWSTAPSCSTIPNATDEGLLVEGSMPPPRRSARASVGKGKGKAKTKAKGKTKSVSNRTEVIDVFYDDGKLEVLGNYDASNPIDVDAPEPEEQADRGIAAYPTPRDADSVVTAAQEDAEQDTRPEGGSDISQTVVDVGATRTMVAEDITAPEPPNIDIEMEVVQAAHDISSEEEREKDTPVPVAPVSDVVLDQDVETDAQDSQVLHSEVGGGMMSIADNAALPEDRVEEDKIERGTESDSMNPDITFEDSEAHASHDTAQTSLQSTNDAKPSVEENSALSETGHIPAQDMDIDGNSESQVAGSSSDKESPNKFSEIDSATVDSVYIASESVRSDIGENIALPIVSGATNGDVHVGSSTHPGDSVVCSDCAHKDHRGDTVVGRGFCSICNPAAETEDRDEKSTDKQDVTSDDQSRTSVLTTAPSALSSAISTTIGPTVLAPKCIDQSPASVPPTTTSPYYSFARPSAGPECHRCILEKAICVNTTGNGMTCDRCKWHNMRCSFNDLEDEGETAGANATELGAAAASSPSRKRQRKANISTPSRSNKRVKRGKLSSSEKINADSVKAAESANTPDTTSILRSESSTASTSASVLPQLHPASAAASDAPQVVARSPGCDKPESIFQSLIHGPDAQKHSKLPPLPLQHTTSESPKISTSASSSSDAPSQAVVSTLDSHERELEFRPLIHSSSDTLLHSRLPLLSPPLPPHTTAVPRSESVTASTPAPSSSVNPHVYPASASASDALSQASANTLYHPEPGSTLRKKTRYRDLPHSRTVKVSTAARPSTIPQIYPSASTSKAPSPTPSTATNSSGIHASAVPQLYPSLSAAVMGAPVPLSYPYPAAVTSTAFSASDTSASSNMIAVTEVSDASTNISVLKPPNDVDNKSTNDNISGRNSVNIQNGINSTAQFMLSEIRPLQMPDQSSQISKEHTTHRMESPNGSSCYTRAPTPPPISVKDEKMRSPPSRGQSSAAGSSILATVVTFSIDVSSARRHESFIPSQVSPAHPPPEVISLSTSKPWRTSQPPSLIRQGSTFPPQAAPEVAMDIDENHLPSPPAPVPAPAPDTVPNMIIQQLDDLRADFGSYKNQSDIEGLKRKVDSMQSTLEGLSFSVARILEKLDGLAPAPAKAPNVVREAEVQTSPESQDKGKRVSFRIDASIQTDPRPKRPLVSILQAFNANGLPDLDDDDDDLSEIEDLQYPEIGL